MSLDENGTCGRGEFDGDLLLGELESHEDERVLDDFRERPTGVQARGRLRETKHAGDDGLQLVQLLADHPQIRIGEFVERAVIVTFFDAQRGLLIFGVELAATDDRAVLVHEPFARERIALFDDAPGTGERIHAEHRTR
ncbi:MAG: hypothetical protein RLZZ221_1786, partial [Verrucomicrobiota bacterium]